MRLSFRWGETPAERKAAYQAEQWSSSVTGSSTLQTYGGQHLQYLQLYRSQPAVRSVVAFIAESAASVPIKTYKRVSDDDRQFLADHKLQRLLEAPNPELSQYEFLRDLVTDLELFDVAFYRRLGNDQALQRLFPDAVELLDEDDFGPAGFRVYKADGTHVELDRSEVLYLHGYGSGRGISPMETLRRVIAEDVAAGEFREGLYKNGMRNAGVIERPAEAPDWSDTARERFVEQLVDRYTGNGNSGRPLLLEEGMQWKNDQVSMHSQEYIAGRELTHRAVANTFRIAPALLGIADAPYSSISEYNRQLYQNALAPRLTFITQGLERQFLAPHERRGGTYVEFSLEAKLRGSFVEQAQIGKVAVGGPWLTVNEWRSKQNLPPLEGGDELVKPTPAVGAPDTGAGDADQPAPSEDGLPDESSTDLPKVDLPTLEDTVRRTFERAEKQAKSSPDRFDAERWTRELTADLLTPAHVPITPEGA